MWGAIAGDIVGSVYEGRGRKIKHKGFEPLFAERARFTDDTVHSVAVMEALLDERDMGETLHRYTRAYPGRGYGGWMRRWAAKDTPEPYGSYGNGSAMRASACGWWARTADEAEALALASAEPTHGHPEGIRGAKAVALAVFLARKERDPDRIRWEVERRTGYELGRTVDEIRPGYRFDVTCQGSVPEALICALESTSYEDAVRNAVSLGGDSDTLAAIAGSVAEALWGMPHEIEEECKRKLDEKLAETAERFEKTVHRMASLYIVAEDDRGKAKGRVDREGGWPRYEIWWSRGVGDRLRIWRPEEGVTGTEAWKACRDVLDRRIYEDRDLRKELVGKTLEGDRELQEHYERQWARDRENRKRQREADIPESERVQDEDPEPTEEELEAEAEEWLEGLEDFDPDIRSPEEVMEMVTGGWCEVLFNQDSGTWYQAEHMPKRIGREMETLGDDAEYLDEYDAVRLYPGLLVPWDYEGKEPITTREERKAAEGEERAVAARLREQADQGDPEACYILSSVYMPTAGTSEAEMKREAARWAGGEGAPRVGSPGWWQRMRDECGISEEEARGWARRSAEGGWPPGQRRYGSLLWSPGRDEHDEVEARRWFEEAARGGDARAQHNMGEVSRGRGKEEGWTETSLQWYRRCAAQGEREDLTPGDREAVAASLCTLGRAAKQAGDQGGARSWMQKAALQGSVEGQTRYARMLQDGADAGQEEMHEALTWLHLAAVQGEPVAQTNLGLALCHGDGTEADEKLGQRWLAEAAEQGYGYAAEVLAFRQHISRQFEKHGAAWFTSTGREAEGRKLFKVGGPPGSSGPAVEVGLNVEIGPGKNRDGGKRQGKTRRDEEAMSEGQVREAAEAGNGEAQLALGAVLLHRGAGAAEEKEGAGWVEAAARQGVTEAMTLAGDCCARGWGRKESTEDARRWYTAAAKAGNVTGLGALVEGGWSLPRLGNVEEVEAQVAAGNAHAMYALGVYLDRGEGIEEDKERAAKLWQEAARQGEPESCWILSTREEGPQAARLCLEAVRGGLARAQRRMGERLKAGEGVRESLKGAKAMLGAAATQNEAEAREELEKMSWGDKVAEVLRELRRRNEETDVLGETSSADKPRPGTDDAV